MKIKTPKSVEKVLGLKKSKSMGGSTMLNHKTNKASKNFPRKLSKFFQEPKEELPSLTKKAKTTKKIVKKSVMKAIDRSFSF